MYKNILTLTIVATLTQVAIAQTGIGQTDEERAAAEKHKKELSERSRLNGEEAFATLCIKYYVPKSKSKELSELLMLREQRKAAYDYIHEESPVKRAKAKLAIDSAFQDSIDVRLIPFNKGISGENISFAMRLMPILNLDEAQRSYIAQKALDIAHQLRINPRKNVWNDEINALRQTLNTEQLDCFFTHKNAGKVTSLMRQTWNKLNEANMTAKLDSARDCAQTYMYYLEQQKINDIYRFYGTSKKKYLAELSKRMPEMVRLYDSLGKRKRIEARKKEVGKEYVW